MRVPNLHTAPKRHLIKIRTFLEKVDSYFEKYKFARRFEGLRPLVCIILDHAYSDIHWSRIEARIWSTKMADNQHFRYINKLPYFKEIYGNWKRCLKAYSYTRKEHWTWSTNMAAMASKFNFECVIQYYTDQWLRLDQISRNFAQ